MVSAVVRAWLSAACCMVALVVSSCTAPAPSSPVPEALVGQWRDGNVDGDGFYDPTNGDWSPPAGGGSSYTFSSDGSYEWAGLTQVTTYNCTTWVHRWERGTVVFDGNSFTRYPVEGLQKYDNGCNPEASREEQRVGEPSSFTWELQVGDGGPDALRVFDRKEQFWARYLRHP